MRTIEPKRVICLYRVSSKKQVENDDIPMQRQACHEFVAQHPDWVIVEEIEEKGVSGYSVRAENRGAIVELTEKAEREEFEILLVFMLDRLGRISEETPFVALDLHKKGIEIWSVKEGKQNYETMTDRLLNYFYFLQAESESKKTSERTKTRLGQIVKEGRYRGGSPAYGYRTEKNGRVNARGHEVHEILIDEEEAVVVRRIFELSAICGYGSKKIATTLTQEGMYDRSGKPFHPSTLQNLLKNVQYMGILRSGTSFSEPFEHLQIVSPEMFEMAQKQIESHRMTYEQSRLSPVRSMGQTLLTGNIFCGVCGARLNSTSVRRAHHKTVGENPRVPVYRCYNRTRHKDLCDGQSTYRAEKIDCEVEEAVKEILARVCITDNEMYIQKHRKSEAEMLRRSMKKLEKKLSAATENRRKLGTHMVDALEGIGPFTAEDLKEQMDLLKEECERITKQMEAQRALLEESERREKSIALQFETLKGYAEVYDNASSEDKRRIVSALIEKVTVSAGTTPGNYDIKIFFRIGLDWLEEMGETG